MTIKRTLFAITLLAALGAATTAGATAAPLGTDPLPAAVDAQRRTIELEGFGRVAFYVDGRGEGRPLVLTHSVNAAASAAEMRPLFEAYAGKRPVVALEWPGFGASSRPDVAYTPELMASALDTFVTELGRDVDVVSLSLGSEFAARAALANPRIQSLTLLSPTGLGAPRGGPQDNAADGSDSAAEESYQRLRQFSGPLYGVIRSWPSIKYFLSKSFVGPVDKELLNYAYRTSRQDGAKYAPLYFLSGGLFNADAYANLYSKLAVPTLVIYDQDAFVNFDRLPKLAEQSNVKAVRIAPTNGLPQFDATRRVVETMNQFYAGQ